MFTALTPVVASKTNILSLFLFSYRVVTGDIVPDRREEFAVQVVNFTILF